MNLWIEDRVFYNIFTLGFCDVLEPSRIYEEKKADYNSVSNFFKTDKVYIEHILNKFSFTISKKDKDLKEFLENAEILKRI